MIWNEKIECLSRDELRKLQAERLRDTVARAYSRVPAQRKKMEQQGVKPEQIRTLEDLNRLPFSTKFDLHENYPFGLFAVPMSEVVEIHASSGTTGKVKVLGYTRTDLETWAEVMARTLTAGGAGPSDLVHNAYGYGLFTGGLGVHYGANRIGASVLPISGGNTKRQIQLMQDFGSTVLCCTPSYAHLIGETALEMGLDLKNHSLRVAFLGAEPWSESMRLEIESLLGVQALDIYGLTEMIGPGVSFECPGKNGQHINEDHFLPEIIDPETGNPLPPGERGELVLTTLTKEAVPFLRYRTGDLSSLDYSPCACGRTTVRMSRVCGRTDDMLIIRGVNVFPSQVENVLMQVEGTEPHYLIVVDRERGMMDQLEIWVEVVPEVFSDEVKQLEALEKKVAAELQSALGISVKVKLVEPKTIARSEGKAKRVVDRRELGK